MTLQNHPDTAGYPCAASLTTPDVDANLHRGAFQGRSKHPFAKPITFEGVTYPSRGALARALGMTRHNIMRAANTGRMDTLGQGRAAGMALAHAARVQPVAAHGWHWPSQKEAAEALGVTPTAVCGYLQRGTFEKHVLRKLGIHSAAAGLPPPVDN